MLKILWKGDKLLPRSNFSSHPQYFVTWCYLSSTIFCYLVLDSYVKTRIRFSLRDKRLFEITKVEITTSTVVVCISVCLSTNSYSVCLCPFVCASVHPPVCIFLCDIVSLSVCMFSFSSFIRPIVRTAYRFLSV